MARQFSNNLEKDLNSPMTPSSATSSSNTPISYKTDVNRKKTTKWANAKPVSYDEGWGDDDEYEYDDDPTPQPISKPAGSRQFDQSLQMGDGLTSPIDKKKNYGDLPPIPGASSRPRANSFDADDEKRHFSSAAVLQQPLPSGSGPATTFSQITGVPSTRNASGPPVLSVQTQLPTHPAVAGLRNQNANVSPTPASGSSIPVLNPTARIRSDSSSVNSPISEPSAEYQAQRDYSPTAAPQPLNTRASPAPQGFTDSPSTSKFPVRKSSLSQTVGPDVTDMTGTPQETTPKPIGVVPASPSGPRSPAVAGKALPFIRPADIYKRRMEEEREKERQSMDSSRPSMDSVSGARSETSESPITKGRTERSSTDSLGARSGQRASMDGGDTYDSGRSRPTLEPVKERKSEYGLEGYNVNDHLQPDTVDPTPHHGLDPSNSRSLDVNIERAPSTSPKLPDLNRMSGFGIDLFGPSKPLEQPSTIAEDNEITPTVSSDDHLYLNDTALRNQPSLGFRSAVDHAFDRKSDSSLPGTPTSRSGIDRSASGSTGTAGISPIMSRVSSTAAGESRSHDVAPTSIPETTAELPTVDEPLNKDLLRETPQPIRRDPSRRRPVSTASIGPVPTPDAALAQSIVAETSKDESLAANTGLNEHEITQSSRPFAEREQSFRPELPGGWTSYATSARTPSPHKEDRPELPPVLHQATAEHDHSDALSEDRDMTPTTAHFPTSATVLHTAGADSSQAIEGRDAHAIVLPAVEEPHHQTPPNIIYPLQPDPTSAGLSASQSAEVDESSTQPKNHLAAETISRSIVAGTTPAPTPPAKDTPIVVAEKSSGYFPPSGVPMIQRPIDQEIPENVLDHQTSNDTQAEEEDDEVLRNEIIQSLSPKPKAILRDDSMLSINSDYPEDMASDPARISSYLPSEYDNYWASTAEEDQPSAVVTAPAQVVDPSFSSKITPPAEVDGHAEHDEHIIHPLSPHKSNTSLDTRPPIPHRFSWEASSENVSALATGPVLDTLPVQPLEVENAMRTDQMLQPEVNETRARSLSPTGHEGLRSHPPSPSLENHNVRDAALLAGATTVLGSAAAAGFQSTQQANSGRRLSLAEEKDPRVNSYPVSPTPPENEHPSRSPQPYFSNSDQVPNDAPLVPSKPPSSVSPIESPSQPQFSQPAKVQGFRDIMAIQSPQQRIQTFEATREQFASMEFGNQLGNWVSFLKANHPEHADVTGFFGGNNASRSKFAKGAAATTTSSQQPYYQQYLNASSPTTSGTPVSRPGPSTPVGTQQGFGSASGRINTQQVQAKGKELLHTAGIFGGKAGKAGKGLLAKGKTKLQQARGSGGDKMSASPPSAEKKPRNERRTSWGMPLTLPRSNGRHDSSPTQAGSRQRAATLTLDTRVPPFKSSMSGATLDDYNVMSAPGILDNLDMTGALPMSESPQGIVGGGEGQHIRHYTVPERSPADQDLENAKIRETNVGDDLQPPAPIGKNQPSWDPFNATPIAEEEAYQFEENSQNQSHIAESHTLGSLSVIADAASTTQRSNSEDAQFHDALEEPNELNEWVMVSKNREQEPRSNPRPEFYQGAQQETQLEEPEVSDQESISFPIMGAKAPPAPTTLSETYISKAAQDQQANKYSVLNRPRGESYASVLDRPRFSYEAPRAMPKEATPSPPRPSAPPSQLSDRAIQLLGSSSPHANTGRGTGRQDTTASTEPKVVIDYRIQPNDTQPQYKAPPGPPPGRIEINPTRIQTGVQSSQAADEPQSTTSFKGLPPIRRTSTFGIGFSARHPKKRFAIDDDEPIPSNSAQHIHSSANTIAAANAAAAAGILNPEARRPSQEYIRPPQTQTSANQPDSTRPPLAHATTSERSQYSLFPAPPKLYDAPKAADYPARRSQDSWRPNGSPTTKRMSGQSFVQGPEILNHGDRGRPLSNQAPTRTFETPPSAAQRYPSLFRPEQPDFEVQDGGDLPAHHYQAPIPREEAFLPRQQTNEYSLPGVGPPADEPRPSSRRNSGVWNEIGNKIRRASQERRNSIQREPEPQAPGHNRNQSQGNGYAESSIASEDTKDQNKLRAKFFGIRSSTGGLGGLLQSKESMVAHHPGSRVDLLHSPTQSSFASTERKRPFFGNSISNFSEKGLKATKLSRGFTTGAVTEEPGKKKRFSNLTTIFGRSKDGFVTSREPSRPQATRELSNNDRQPLESPAPTQSMFPRHPAVPQRRTKEPIKEAPRAAIQPKNFLAKIAGASDQTRSQEESKTRKSSATGLLSGIMGRRSYQQDKRDDSSSQGTKSQGSQPKSLRPNQVPPARTYSDLQEQSTPVAQYGPQAPWIDPVTGRAAAASMSQQHPLPDPDRGRRTSRQAEPRYDNVPIPGGYQSVRAEGVPKPGSLETQIQQPSPRYAPHQSGSNTTSPTSPSLPGGPRRFMDQVPNPSPPPPTSPSSHHTLSNIGAAPLGFFDSQRSNRRISREDLLARSPARAPTGQQRPYQLSLPEDPEEREPIDAASVRSPQTAILRLPQPTVRHPASPAGYPLPDEVVFSPINPQAASYPAPPPPNWPRAPEERDGGFLGVGGGLDRSNTGISAVSGMSGPRGQESRDMLGPQKDRGRDVTPSPTPPTPGVTPPPPHANSTSNSQLENFRRANLQARDANQGLDIRRTEVERGVSPDLYSASPKMPKVEGRERGQEEKIYYDPERAGGEEEEEEHEAAVMVATSYPGQEWNPYAGVVDDGYGYD